MLVSPLKNAAHRMKLLQSNNRHVGEKAFALYSWSALYPTNSLFSA
jgi:hypothetical protein